MGEIGHGGGMILYLGSGPRRYGDRPVPVYAREGWEFQLIRRGSCDLLGTGGKRLKVEGGTLWVFSPREAHGWGGSRGEECEVEVVHFSRVPEPLGSLLAKRGLASVRLSAEALAQIDRCFEPVLESLQTPTPLSALQSERLLQELSLQILGGLPREEFGAFRPASSRTVSVALSYFREHMHEGVAVEETSRAVFQSAGHLRRLFREVLGVSPREAFMAERMKRAEELLLNSGEKLEAVAEACGFDSARSFIRAFKARSGTTPSRWRETKTSRSV